MFCCLGCVFRRRIVFWVRGLSRRGRQGAFARVLSLFVCWVRCLRPIRPIRQALPLLPPRC